MIRSSASVLKRSGVDRSMPKAKFENVAIDGISVVLGQVLKSIDDDAHLFAGSLSQIERIKKTIGLDRRRVVAPGTTAADLCENAARNLMRGLGLSFELVDAVICVTQTPDHFQPCNAAILHGKLGLQRNCAAFDINLGCSGWVVGLYVASLMIEAGGCNKVLLVAGDTMSCCVNPRDRSVAPLFGDAGSATLLSRNCCKSWYSLHSDGAGSNVIVVPAGAFRNRRDSKTGIEFTDSYGNVRSDENLYMDGAEVFNFSIREEPPAVKELLEFAERSVEKVDYFLFHQANKYIIGNIARRLKLPSEKVPFQTVERYGNQSSASIPCTICDTLADDAKRGGLALLFSGFGVGLSWATCLIEDMPPFYSNLCVFEDDCS